MILGDFFWSCLSGTSKMPEILKPCSWWKLKLSLTLTHLRVKFCGKNILLIPPAPSERNPWSFCYKVSTFTTHLNDTAKGWKPGIINHSFLEFLTTICTPITGTKNQKCHQNITHPPLEKWLCFGWCWKPLAEGDDKGRIVSLSLFFRLEVLQDLMQPQFLLEKETPNMFDFGFKLTLRGIERPRFWKEK